MRWCLRMYCGSTQWLRPHLCRDGAFRVSALADMGPQEAAAAFAEMAGLAALRTRRGCAMLAFRLMRWICGRDAMNQTRLLVNNPRAVDESGARAIYQAHGRIS